MYTLRKLTRLHLAVMMIKDCKPLIELENIHMGTSTGKVCKTKLLKYKKLILMIMLTKVKQNMI